MPVPLSIRCRNGETIERTVPVDPWLEGRRQTSVEIECVVESVTIAPARDYPDVDRSNTPWEEGAPAS
jgi:hypothetical protein